MTSLFNSIIIKSFTNQLNKCSDLTQFPPITKTFRSAIRRTSLFGQIQDLTQLSKEKAGASSYKKQKLLLTLIGNQKLQLADSLVIAKTTGSKDGLSQKILTAKSQKVILAATTNGTKREATGEPSSAKDGLNFTIIISRGLTPSINYIIIKLF